MKKLISLLIIFILFRLNIYSQQNFWEKSNGPQGGFITAFAINPAGHIFAGTEEGMYRSTDDGNTWIEVGKGLSNKTITSIAINQTGHIFIATGGGIYDLVENIGIYRSTDNGENWVDISNGLWCFTRFITVDSNGNIYIGIGDRGIFRSSDEGKTWDVIYNDYSQNDFSSLVISSTGIILAGCNSTNSKGILRSTDNGKTWNQQFYYPIRALSISSNGNIFAGTDYYGILKSTDNGENWIEVNNGIFDSLSIPYVTDVRSLTVDENGVIYAGVMKYFDDGRFNSKIYYSTNSGDSWVGKNNGIPIGAGDINCLIGSKDGFIFAGMNGKGIFCTSDRGENWMEKNNGLNNSYVRSLIINSKGYIFGGVLANGIFRSTDNGDHWEKIFEDDPGSSSLIINSQDHIFAGINGKGIFRSTDNGDTWSQINNGLTNNKILALTISPTGILYAGTGEFDGEIFYSTDNGESWHNMNHIFNHVRWSFNLAVNSQGNLFAGTGEGIYTITDHGESWKEIDKGLSNKVIQCLLAGKNGNIYIGTGSGVFYSKDNGTNWDQINDGFDYNNIECLAENSEGRIFAGISYGGIYQLSYNNYNWWNINYNLTNTSVHSIAFTKSDILLCGTSSGVFRSLNSVTTLEYNKKLSPVKIALSQNYPNPFNPVTVISYQLPVSGNVTLKVYDVLGKEVATLVNEEKPAGYYSVNFNGSSLSSGVYFYRLQAGSFVQTKKLILMK